VRWLVGLAMLAATGTAAADPAPRPRVAVVVDLVANLDGARATELSAAMAAALGRTLEVDAIGGADVARRLPASGLPEDCLVVPTCLRELATRLDATELLFLSMVQVGDAVAIDATWVGLATGEIRARPRLEITADARAGERFANAAARLLPHAAPRSRPVTLAPVVTVPPTARRRMTPTTWALGGASLAALGGGLGLGLSARATYQRCEREPDRCDAGTRDGLGRRALAADVLTAAAVLGGGVTLYLYLRSARRAPVRAALTPLPTGAIADVRVEF
jgi:hypothetical protein